MSLHGFYEKEITALGNRLGLEGSFLIEFGFSQMAEVGDEYQRLQQENAAQLALLEEIGNELLHADIDGTFYAEAGASSFEHALAKKLNSLIFN
jgi:hypothetical protein